jgi:hypothetical protein
MLQLTKYFISTPQAKALGAWGLATPLLPLVEKQAQNRLRRGGLSVEHPRVPLEPQRPHDKHDKGVCRLPIGTGKPSCGLRPPLSNHSELRGDNVWETEARDSSRPDGRRKGALLYCSPCISIPSQ